ncbi:MAG: hypothetical protein IT445_06900 [Phycisphaeraceae bacterium]|nr:hypothetical protein [Phycisphaeraceae bacterium]
MTTTKPIHHEPDWPGLRAAIRNTRVHLLRQDISNLSRYDHERLIREAEQVLREQEHDK